MSKRTDVANVLGPGGWAGISIRMGDITDASDELRISKWLGLGRGAAGGKMCFLMVLALNKAIPGAALQLHEMRKLIAADVLRHWYLFSDVWSIRMASKRVERPLSNSDETLMEINFPLPQWPVTL